MVDIETQGFVPAALSDEVGRIQSHILVQDFVVLEKAQRKQKCEIHEVNPCHLLEVVPDVCTTPRPSPPR